MKRPGEKRRGKRAERKPEESGGAWLAVMGELLKGAGIAAAAALLLLFGCALLASGGMLSEGALDRAVPAVCVLGSFLGALPAVRRIGKSPLPVGAGVGAILFLLLLSAGSLLFDSASVFNGGGMLLLSCLCGGAMAGILGSRPKKKRKR